MKSSSKHTSFEQLERESKRREFHLLERRLAKLQHELDDLRDEIAEFEEIYAEQMSERIAELESLEKEIGRIDSQRGGRGEPRRKYSAGVTDDEDYGGRHDHVRVNAMRQIEGLKDIYRRVAKAVHPDLSCHEPERRRRQKLMAEANRAYAAEDHVTLLAILEEWELEQEGRGGTGQKSETELLIHRISLITEQIRAVEAEIIRIRNGDIYRLVRQVQQARSQGRDVLAEMAAKLEADILGACQRLNAAGRKHTPSFAAEQVRFLVFPQDRTAGFLHIRNRDERSFLDWRKFGEAIGNVAVPSGKSLRIDMGRERGPADMTLLSGLTPRDLQSCYLYQGSDTDIVHLLRFRELEELYLSGEGVSGEGLIHLLELKNLERLYLYDTSVDDDAIMTLGYLNSLKFITFCSGGITEAGLHRLRTVLPACSIVNLAGRK